MPRKNKIAAIAAAEAAALAATETAATETAAPVTYVDMIAAITADDVLTADAAMVAAFIERENFERGKSADGTIGKAFYGARKALVGNTQVARMLAALNVSADAVVNRARRGNARANLYALHKLANIAAYASGKNDALDAVSLAFISSLLIFQKVSGDDALFDTDAQETSLTRARSYRALADHVKEALAESATRATMTGGAATQASQCRTMLENIGMIERVDNHNVRVNLNHALARRLAERMNIDLAA